MQVEPTRLAGGRAVIRLSGVIRTRYALAVCIVCGHERFHGSARLRGRRPTSGETLNSFTLCGDLTTRR
jgi:hypothetical protein